MITLLGLGLAFVVVFAIGVVAGFYIGAIMRIGYGGPFGH